MYLIDEDKNDIIKLDSPSFKKAGFEERKHLQEWIRKNPSALGEELLIIQDEFSGFDDTNRRLDLLALDEDGNLVIIENKRDDSGGNIAWQALNYTAYCSTLTKQQVVDIYGDYLTKHNKEGNSEKIICDFLDKKSLKEVEINDGSAPRIILVASKFRKEDTATVLWLDKKGIQIKCMKTSLTSLKPFSEKYLFDINQIIPIPEAEDYMISLSSKEHKKNIEKTLLKNKQSEVKKEFWGKLLKHFTSKKYNTFASIAANETSKIEAELEGFSGCFCKFNQGKKHVSVYFKVQKNKKDKGDCIVEALQKHDSMIEESFGQKPKWKKQTDIGSQYGYMKFQKHFTKDINDCDEADWQERFDWLLENAWKLESTIKELEPEIQAAIESPDSSE